MKYVVPVFVRVDLGEGISFDCPSAMLPKLQKDLLAALNFQSSRIWETIGNGEKGISRPWDLTGLLFYPTERAAGAIVTARRKKK